MTFREQKEKDGKKFRCRCRRKKKLTQAEDEGKLLA